MLNQHKIVNIDPKNIKGGLIHRYFTDIFASNGWLSHIWIGLVYSKLYFVVFSPLAAVNYELCNHWPDSTCSRLSRV